MGKLGKFAISKKTHPHDALRVNMGTRKVSANLRLYKFRDKDTQQIVLYIPSLDISGYGSTLEKAYEMIRSSIEYFIEQLAGMSAKKVEEELFSLGWKHDKIKNEEYAKAYIDITGQLKNFNAVADEVEILTLEA